MAIVIAAHRIWVHLRLLLLHYLVRKVVVWLRIRAHVIVEMAPTAIIGVIIAWS